MSGRFGFFLIFLVLFHVEVEAVRLHISGELQCANYFFFKYLVAVKEFDWLFQNDRIYTSKYFDSTPPHSYSVDTENLDDSDELENDKYEIFVSFWHTCNDNGTWMYYESRVGYVAFTETDVYLNHNIDLYNAEGELTWRDWEDWVTSNS